MVGLRANLCGRLMCYDYTKILPSSRLRHFFLTSSQLTSFSAPYIGSNSQRPSRFGRPTSHFSWLPHNTDIHLRHKNILMAYMMLEFDVYSSTIDWKNKFISPSCSLCPKRGHLRLCERGFCVASDALWLIKLMPFSVGHFLASTATSTSGRK